MAQKFKEHGRKFEDLLPKFTKWESQFYDTMGVLSRIFRYIQVRQYGDKTAMESRFHPSLETLSPDFEKTFMEMVSLFQSRTGVFRPGEKQPTPKVEVVNVDEIISQAMKGKSS